ncbi:MAG: hypothetical protein JSV88_33725 [Candidatus Aminicenantes bacterium]|nr:MAG: hypothetical protein JSV88_33725 [Candidatus Aminicenantes bacterium]
MLIANPIYDTVFKYLMEDIDIAKGIISTIIDEEIVTLDLKAQESVYKSEKSLTVYHLDFIAKLRMKQGHHKNVLIELQKSNLPYDIMRFRRYLGEQYKKIDEVMQDDGTLSKESLPIITIYFLGFYISKTLPAVIKVDRRYIDVLGGKDIEERNDFIEKLTHNSYVIQVPGLKLQMRSRLEWVLSIFKQENFIEADSYRLKSYEYEPQDELMKTILKQLEKAAGDKKLLRTLELEEMAEREYENAFGELERKMMKQEKIITEKDKIITEKDKVIEGNKKLIDEKDQYIRELLVKLEGKK